MEFHNSIPIPYWASLNLHAINAHACSMCPLIGCEFDDADIWCKSLVADSDCVAILCSVLCSQTWLNILKVYLQYCAKL